MSKNELAKLPKSVAKAVDYYRENVAIENWEKAILTVAMDAERWIGAVGYCEIIKEYVENADNLRLLLQAVVNGYEVEVEETPEDKVREYFKITLDKANSMELSDLDSKFYAGEYRGIQKTLFLLNKTIEGAESHEKP